MRFLALTLSLLFLPITAPAETLALPPEKVREYAKALDQNRSQLIKRLFAMAPDGRLTPELIQLHEERMIARLRHKTRGEWLVRDLNGDLSLSIDEIRRLSPILRPNSARQIETRRREFDLNSDGILTLEEMDAESAKQFAQQRPHVLGDLLAMDANNDGILTTEDIIATFEVLSKTPEAQLSALEHKGCDMPTVSDDAEIILFNVKRAEAVSTVAVSGLDQETRAGSIRIEAGTRPIYLIATSRSPLILKITGATDRLEHVVIASENGLGVVGVPAEYVSFVPQFACSLDARRWNSADAQMQADAQLSVYLGRVPDQHIHEQRLDTTALPSGVNNAKQPVKRGGVTIITGNRRVQMTENGLVDLGVAQEDPVDLLLRAFPAGISSSIPEDVVTLAGSAEAYDILPSWAGITQLVDAGALREIGRGTYAIEEPIARLPAGLGRRPKFLLRRGVPMPKGASDRNTIVSEDTGECLTKRC
ncbi:MAG: hypothetical protein ABJG96_04725 [Paracoccaceae bacterium]